jgi:transitional endoplasmic reticulum ATPase
MIEIIVSMGMMILMVGATYAGYLIYYSVYNRAKKLVILNADQMRGLDKLESIEHKAPLSVESKKKIEKVLTKNKDNFLLLSGPDSIQKEQIVFIFAKKLNKQVAMLDCEEIAQEIKSGFYTHDLYGKSRVLGKTINKIVSLAQSYIIYLKNYHAFNELTNSSLNPIYYSRYTGEINQFFYKVQSQLQDKSIVLAVSDTENNYNPYSSSNEKKIFKRIALVALDKTYQAVLLEDDVRIFVKFHLQSRIEESTDIEEYVKIVVQNCCIHISELIKIMKMVDSSVTGNKVVPLKDWNEAFKRLSSEKEIILHEGDGYKSKVVKKQEIVRSPSLQDSIDKIKSMKKGAIMLYGPPGTGKTTLASFIACEMKRVLFETVGSSFNTKYRGSGTSSLLRLFDAIKESKNSILLIDEIDALAAERRHDSSGGRDDAASIATLLAELDKLKKDPNNTIIIIGITNMVSSIDAAVLRRFEVQIEVGLPQEKEIEQLLALYLKGAAEESDINKIIKAVGIQDLVGVTSADIETLVMQARQHAQKRQPNLTSPALTIADMSIAKAIILSRSSRNKPYDITFPNNSLQDIILNSDVLLKVDRIISAIRLNIDEGLEINGFLFYGPPGTGKTSLVLGIANSLKMKTIRVKFSQLPLKKIYELFNTVISNAPCILFIDEFDSFAQSRESTAHTNNGIVNQLLREIDRLRSNKVKVILIAVTNHLTVLDSAIIRRGRFDQCIEVSCPDQQSLSKLLNYYLQKLGQKAVSQEGCLQCVKELEKLQFTGGDVEYIVKSAYVIAVENKRKNIKFEDLMQAIKEERREKIKSSKSTVTEETSLSMVKSQDTPLVINGRERSHSLL